MVTPTKSGMDPHVTKAAAKAKAPIATAPARPNLFMTAAFWWWRGAGATAGIDGREELLLLLGEDAGGLMGGDGAGVAAFCEIARDEGFVGERSAGEEGDWATATEKITADSQTIARRAHALPVIAIVWESWKQINRKSYTEREGEDWCLTDEQDEYI